MNKEWTKYTAEGNDYVPMSQWGRDHWSTLAYLHTCCEEHGGAVDNRKMRTDPRLHRELVGISAGGIQDGRNYPTRLLSGELAGHDDWSCLEDMISAGLILGWTRVVRRSQPFSGSEAKVQLTKAGAALALALIAHKMDGGNYANFGKSTYSGSAH